MSFGRSSDKFGHLVEADSKYVVPEFLSEPVEASNIRTLLDDMKSIPVGAYMTVSAPRLEKNSVPDLDFFVFSSEAAFILVRKFEPHSAHVDMTGFPRATVKTVLDISEGLPPWAEFLQFADENEDVWRVDTDDVPNAASMYLESGFLVACCGKPATFTRVKGMQLKWMTDTECATTMSTIIDAMPGFSDTASEIYTDDFQIQRPMLSWAMLSGCLSKDATVDTTKLCEPIRSYCQALSTVKEYRSRTGTIEGFVEAPLSYNVAAKLTYEQQMHASTIFYWAALHGRRLLPDAHLRKALGMYLMFGFVLVRKRAYEFHGEEKRSRVAPVRNALFWKR